MSCECMQAMSELLAGVNTALKRLFEILCIAVLAFVLAHCLSHSHLQQEVTRLKQQKSCTASNSFDPRSLETITRESDAWRAELNALIEAMAHESDDDVLAEAMTEFPIARLGRPMRSHQICNVPLRFLALEYEKLAARGKNVSDLLNQGESMRNNGHCVTNVQLQNDLKRVISEIRASWSKISNVCKKQ
ncbi:hypothetical protein HDU80_002357, partial [Chytriomyces hyalinus]